MSFPTKIQSGIDLLNALNSLPNVPKESLLPYIILNNGSVNQNHSNQLLKQTQANHQSNEIIKNYV